MNLAKQAISGIKWSFLSRIGRQITQILTTTILAKLLDPKAFGLVAIATIFTNFIVTFSDFGTSAAVIKAEQPSNKLLSTLFWFNIAFGICAFLLLYVFSPIISSFFHEPLLVDILRVLGISFVFSSFGILHKTLLEKKLAFNILSKVELISTLMAAVIAISLAIFDYGVWSLVFYTLGMVSISSILFITVNRWKPRFYFDLFEMKKIFSFTLNFTGFNILNYLLRNMDKFIIGRFLGTENLGYYSLAHKLMIYPLTNISDVIKRVMFPYFSNFQKDNKKIFSSYLNVLKVISLITFPAMLGLMAIANDFVLYLFGPKWETTAILLVVLAPVGLIQSLTTTTGTIFLTKDRADLLFKTGLIWGFILILAFVVGLKWGLIGIAVAYLFANIIWVLPLLKISISQIDANLKDTVFPLLKIMVFSLIMALLLFLFNRYTEIQLSYKFFTEIILGVSVYSIIVWLFYKNEMIKLFGLIKNK